jgi:hypothetical protein
MIDLVKFATPLQLFLSDVQGLLATIRAALCQAATA